MDTLKLKRRGVLSIKSYYFRSLFLVLLAAPAFSHDALNYLPQIYLGVKLPPVLTISFTIFAYTLLVYLVIFFSFGLRGVTLACAFTIPLACVVAFTMAALPKIPLVGDFLLGSKSEHEIESLALVQFFTMGLVLPLGQLIVHSFPPSEIISKLKAKNSPSQMLVKFAIVLRVYAIVIDGVASFLVAWKEENPRTIVPRHSKDTGNIEKFWKLPFWLVAAAKTWSLALVIHAIEQIPQLVEQLDLTIPESTENEK